MALRFSAPVVFSLVLFGAPAARAEDPQFVPLFNGVDLTGWVNVNCADDTFTVKDGMIVCSGHPTGVMRTAKMYENFILELDYRHLQKGGNSGLFIWSDALTAKGQPFTRAIECQVMDGIETADYTSDGDMFAIHGAHMKPDRPHPKGWERCLPSEKRSKPSPEWNHYRVIAKDGTLKLELNGKEVSGGSEINPRKGYICLESEGGLVNFKDIKIAELPPSMTPKGELGPRMVSKDAPGFRSLFNGKDLTGWKATPENAQHWKVSDWVLDYDGKGQDLWSEEEFSDFELIADWRWSGAVHDIDVPDVKRNGETAKDAAGNPKVVHIKEAGDSGIFLRGDSKSQINIWCWPVGSGEIWGYRNDMTLSPEIRAACTPKETADAPIGEWNRFIITMRGSHLTVILNGKTVIENVELPGVKARGPIALQHHGWPIQFANLYVRDLMSDVPNHRATMPSPHYEERMNAIAARAHEHDANIAFVGDSITEGWEGNGKAVWDERFAPLSAIDLGVSGDETEHVAYRFQSGHYDGIHPKVAVLLIGTNNLGNVKHTPKETADGVRLVLNDMLTTWPKVKVLLLGVFPRGQSANDPFRAQIIELNGMIAKFADDRRVFFKDIGASLSEKDGSLSPEIMPDFLHLSPKGYQIWADAIAEDVKRLMGS